MADPKIPTNRRGTVHVTLPGKDGHFADTDRLSVDERGRLTIHMTHPVTMDPYGTVTLSPDTVALIVKNAQAAAAKAGGQ